MAVRSILYGQRRLSDYAGVAEPSALAAMRQSAHTISGLRVLHLSAGRFGGRVAETLSTLVLLQRDIGILADWKFVSLETMPIWAEFHRSLAGLSSHWTLKDSVHWYSSAEHLAPAIGASDYDIVVIHDPELLALATIVQDGRNSPEFVWHCHFDSRDAEPDAWAAVRFALSRFKAVLFPSVDLSRYDVPVEYVGIARPGLDSRSPTNLPIEPSLVAGVAQRFGIDPGRPTIGLFAPIDERYAPLEALEVYRLVRRRNPEVQVLLAEPSVAAPTESSLDVKRIGEAALDDPDIHLLSRHEAIGSIELNALQRQVSVALQLAGAYGQHWGVAECQLKGKPAVVGRGCHLPWTVAHGVDGFVADNTADAAELISRLLCEPELARSMGDRARERATGGSIVSGLLPDYIRAFRTLTGSGTGSGQGSRR